MYSYAKYDRLVGGAAQSRIVRLLGSGDQLSGGVALTEIGVAALAIGGAALVVLPAIWILRADGLARAVA